MIVIPTYNHFDYAARAVESALTNTLTCDPFVVVVDDASPEWGGPDPPESLSRLWGLHPGCHLATSRFEENGGLTRSWNHGLGAARIAGCDYCCVTNSDVVFPVGWDAEIVKGLEKFSLVGPVTNAPGTEQNQYVGRYSAIYSKLSNWAKIQVIQNELSKVQAGRFKETPLNGFCLVAKTQTWHDNAFDADHVFKPRNDFNSKGQPNPTPLMTLNEYELQARWRAAGLKTAACLGSYVYHYRAVSRGDAHKRGDWARIEQEGADT